MILKIKDVLQKKCGFLTNPMGLRDTEKMSRNVPVVHPVLKDHFRKNTAFVDGRYQVLKEQRRAYKYAPEITYDDIIGLVV